MTHDTRAKWFMRDAKRDYVGPQYSETAMVGAASLGFAVGFGFAVLLLWVMSMDAV